MRPLKLEKISVTKIQMARRCPLQLYHTLTQPKPLKKNIYLFMGIVFHEVLEAYFHDKLMGIDQGATYYTKLAYDLFEKGKDGVDFGKFEEMEAHSKVEQNLKAYFEQYAGSLYPSRAQDIERFFRLEVRQGDRKLILTGKIDLIVKGGYVLDHKTGRQDKDWSDEAQAYLYPYGLKLQGESIQGFRFAIANNGTVRVVDVPYREEKAIELLNFAFRIQKDFEEGVFLANIKECKFCDFKHTCKESKYYDEEVVENL